MAPNPRDPSSFSHRNVLVTSGLRYHLIDQAPEHWTGPIQDAPTVLLCHGFPDLWYGYRYQICDFSARGWRVICPSMLGYCDSSKPIQVEPYGFKSVAYDLNSLLNELGIHKKVVVVGHDWGGMVAWRFVHYFPERAIAIASVCTPYLVPATPSTPRMTDEFLVKALPNFGYQLYFKSPEAVEEISEVLDIFLANMHSPALKRLAREKPAKQNGNSPGSWVQVGRMQASMRKLIAARRAGQLPEPPSEPELDYYIETFRKGGIAGPLSWYKTRDVNHDDESTSNLGPFPSELPCLFIAAGKDPALPPEMGTSKSVLASFPAGNLEIKIVDGADHWCLVDERFRGVLTDTLGTWIETVLAGKWKPTGTAISHL